MTPYLLGGLCLGQALIAFVLIAIYGKLDHGNRRADKMLLTWQELADRLGEQHG